MRSTRRWFYLTGSLSVLVLALMGVLWAMSVAAAPPGATELTAGELSTDVTVVSPDTSLDDADNPVIASGDRLVEATLVNVSLDKVEYVGAGPSGQASDFDLNTDNDNDAEDVILVTLLDGVFDGDLFRVFILGASPGDTRYTTADTTTNIQSILPVVDRNGSGTLTAADIEIADEDDAGTMTVGPDELTVDTVLDGANGRIRFLATDNIAAGAIFGIRYATSPQETALVNVKGDAGNMDVLLVEDASGPSGEYVGTFVVADKIIIDLGTGRTNFDGIVHEQHNVPSGLFGNREVSEEIIELTAAVNTGSTFAVTLSKAPIRSTTGAAGPGTTDVTINSPAGVTVAAIMDAATGRVALQTSNTKALSDGDEIKISYRGSDNFRITVDFSPIQTGGSIAGTITDLIVPSSTDIAAVSADIFQIISVNPATGDVRLGVIVGTGDGEDDLDEALGSHVTVVGVSYLGSQQFEITSALSTGGEITATLDAAVEDSNNDDVISGDDVVVVIGGAIFTGRGVVSTGGSRTVTFGPVNQSVAAGTTFAVAYAREVGANAKNALLNVGDRPIIQVGAGSRVTINSDDDRTTVDVESDAPDFENPGPAGGFATTDIAQTISLDITDALAGVDTDSIQFHVASVDGDDFSVAGNRAQRFLTGDADEDSNIWGDDDDEAITVTTEGNVVTASVDLDDLDKEFGVNFVIEDDDVTTVFWFVTASDEAGNKDTSDADGDANGVQGFELRIDPKDPALVDVFIGEQWDADDERIEGDRRLVGEEFLNGSSNRSMIRVEFDEELDGNSITASDFSVTDADGNALTIEEALWFDEDNSDTRSQTPVVRNSVFLKLADPVAPDAALTVELVGSITDAAGNSISNVTQQADDVIDGIAPAATVTLDTTLSTEDVTVTVSTDEDIHGLEPLLELFVSTSDDPDIAVSEATGINAPRSKRTAGENIWTFNLSIANSNTYSVVVTVQDSNRNQSVTGKEDWTDSGSTFFQIDDSLPRPLDDGNLNTTPTDGKTDATVSDPFFIEIKWLSEDDEYVGDTQQSVGLTKAVLDEGDGNERDVMAFASTRDGRKWTISVPDISLGDHTLTFNGEDALGNTLDDDEELDFTVVARPSFALDLGVGMNLVSIPGEPEDDDINSVFGASEAVDLVFTRDGDLWKVAQRDAETGVFEATGTISDLTTFDAAHAYWVRSNASVTVEIEIPALGAQQILPSIDVKGNQWNLVPVISLLPLEKTPQDSTLDADDYLGGNWTRAFTFDVGKWQRRIPATDIHQCSNPDQADAAANIGDCGTQDPGNSGEFFTVNIGDQSDDFVQIGRGYWVWFTEDDTITP